MYFQEKRIGFSDIGPDYKIKLSKILDLYQNVTISQSEEQGIGVKYLKDRGAAWLLSSWQVVVERYPELDEQVLVGTAPYQFKGVLGMRNFVLKTKEGEVLSYANSMWSYVDINNMRLTRIPPDVAAMYKCEEPLEMDYAPRRIALPWEEKAENKPASERDNKGDTKDMPVQKVLEPIYATYYNIDSNNHVNNAQYIAMAEDIVPEGRRARQVRAEYRTSAVCGATLVPHLYDDREAGVHTLSLANEEDAPYVIVEFKDYDKTGN